MDMIINPWCILGNGSPGVVIVSIIITDIVSYKQSLDGGHQYGEVIARLL